MTELLPAFAALWISEKTLQALAKKWFEEPSPIQVQVIPLLLANEKDIIGQAETGTGKTAAFGIPLIEKLKPNGNVQVIILVPTRELAIQVAEEINSLQHEKKLSIVSIYGWQNYDIQLRALKRGVDIVVGTPGRVIDHINRKTLKLDKISNLILDEADEMLNMWFIDDIKEIFQHTNPEKRVLLFSATMPKEILLVAKKYMRDYELVAIKQTQLTTTQTNQIYFEVSSRDKFEALCRIIDIESDFYGIVFCKTKVDVDYVASKLMERGYAAQALHGDVQQKQRERILGQFKKKTTTILVATDVAARGIDVQDISHIINYALPQDPESYIHRVGRTGRAGKTWTAITFVTADEYKKLVYFQRATRTDIKKGEIPQIDNIIQTKKAKFKENITGTIAGEPYKKYKELAKEILKDCDAEDVVAALIKMAYADEFDEDFYHDLEKVNIDRTWKSRLFFALGKKKGYTTRSLIEFITKETEVPASEMSEVSVLEEFSFVTVPFVEAEVIMQLFERKRQSGGRSLVSKAKSREEVAQRRWGESRRFGEERKTYGSRSPSNYGNSRYSSRDTHYGDRPYGDRGSYGTRDAGRGSRFGWSSTRYPSCNTRYGERSSYGERKPASSWSRYSSSRGSSTPKSWYSAKREHNPF